MNRLHTEITKFNDDWKAMHSELEPNFVAKLLCRQDIRGTEFQVLLCDLACTYQGVIAIRKAITKMLSPEASALYLYGDVYLTINAPKDTLAFWFLIHKCLDWAALFPTGPKNK